MLAPDYHYSIFKLLEVFVHAFRKEELQKVAKHWDLDIESDRHRIWNPHRAVQIYFTMFQNGQIQRPLI